MSKPAFVAGDWGTSHLRLSLCDADGVVLRVKTGPGVNTIAGDVGASYFSLVRDWDEEFGIVPAILCGMAGSTIGWRNAPYRSCPARPDSIASSALLFEEGDRLIAIAPGLSCRNRLMLPDVMRGEETQIVGAIRSEPKLAQGRHLLCMPGTHTKWVVIKNGIVEHFLTGVTGELYDILREHSVLVGDHETGEVAGGAPFADALEKTRLHPDAELIHLLFAVRSRQLMGELKNRSAAAYLSGLVIGQDVAGALRVFRSELSESKHVFVIGAPRLGELYASALKQRDVVPTTVDGATSSVAGLTALYRSMINQDGPHGT